MSYLVRGASIMVFALLISAMAGPASAQVNAIKDAWLVMKVHSEMIDEDVLSGSDIDVDVKNGVVTLQGTVPSAAARARALDVAKKNDGVKNVVDQLKIAPAGSDRGDRAANTMDRAADKTKATGRSAGHFTPRIASRSAPRDSALSASERPSRMAAATRGCRSLAGARVSRRQSRSVPPSHRPHRRRSWGGRGDATLAAPRDARPPA